jgi:hypothetical protein
MKNFLILNIMRYIFLIVGFFIFSKMEAQVPGYQGKKMIVEVSENMYRFPLNVFKLPDVAKNIRFRPGVYAEYVIGRKSAWALNYENHGNVSSTANYNAKNGNDNCVATFKRHTNRFGLQYIHYTRAKWCLAPIGRYWAFGLAYITSNNVQTEDPAANCKSPYSNFRTKNYFGNISYGSRTVLWDRATVNIGVQLNVPLPTAIYEKADVSNNAALGGKIKTDIIIDNFLKVYLNIGLLTF